MIKNKKILILLIISILLNTSLIYDKYFKKIDEPVIKEIVKIETVVKTIKVPIETTTKNIVEKNIKEEKTASENLSILENSSLNLKVESFDITEGDDGKLHIPKTIYGEANLGYLYYDIEIDLNSNIEYKKSLWDIRVMNAGLFNISPTGQLLFNTSWFLQKNFLYPFDLNFPIFGNSINIGIGLQGICLTRPVSVFRGLNLDIGGIYQFNGQPGLIIGLSIKL